MPGTLKLPPPRHKWSVTPRAAVRLQRELAGKVNRRATIGSARLVAGADLAFSPDKEECVAGVVVWDVRLGEIVERHVVRRKVGFPYVSGLLSFREGPAVLAALQRLRSEPDVFLFDGHGYAHPRRFGLASHVGLLIDRPSIGCAKSVLVGEFDPPGQRRGSTSALVHRGEPVGAVVRTRDRVRPVFVSVGHRLTLAAAVRIVLACCTRFRLPEPTRQADKLVARHRLL